jgi:hypothetical protein
VDVDAIRSRFIQDNLRCALEQRDRERAVRTLRAFRNYFQWFESRLPDPEKVAIVGQLEQLDDAYAAETSDEGTPRASAR